MPEVATAGIVSGFLVGYAFAVAIAVWLMFDLTFMSTLPRGFGESRLEYRWRMLRRIDLPRVAAMTAIVGFLLAIGIIGFRALFLWAIEVAV